VYGPGINLLVSGQANSGTHRESAIDWSVLECRPSSFGIRRNTRTCFSAHFWLRHPARPRNGLRRGDEFLAIGAQCTHYSGPLAEGLIVGDTVRCRWHHACFSLRNCEALRAPALDPVPCWRVERLGDKILVREKASPPAPKCGTEGPSSVVIVGGGAAGLAAADMLRREGYDGPLTIVSADTSPPVDRPNLSKDYLAGAAQEEWIPLRPSDYYRDRRIETNHTACQDEKVGDLTTYYSGGTRRGGVASETMRQENTQ
jgi:nitrite reductase/ring-hydroxylating ferredoxin subunit